METIYTVNIVLFNKQSLQFTSFNICSYTMQLNTYLGILNKNMQSKIFNRPFYNCSTHFAHGLSLNRGNVLVKSEFDCIKKNNVLFNLIIYRPNKRTKEFRTKRTLNGGGGL